MKVVQISSTGGPEVLQLVDLDEEAPVGDEVQIRVVAAGVNYIDLHHRTGRYPAELPMVLGREAAGIVEAVGPDVRDFSVGDRAAFVLVHADRGRERSANRSGRCGGYAELVNVPARSVTPVPEALDLRTAAALMLQGLTAHALATDAHSLRSGDVVVVHSAAGGVGLLLCQLCSGAGARVIGVTSSGEKAEVVRAVGVDEVLLYGDGELAPRVRAATGGVGADVVYDAVGKDTFESSLDCLRVRGTLVLYGQASGRVPPFDVHSLSPRGSLRLSLLGVGHFVQDTEEFRWRVGELFTAVEAGELQVRIDRTFSLGEVAEAHAYLEQRRSRGKVLLIP